LQGGECQGQDIERLRHRLSMKVAARDHLAVGEDQRIVGGGVELHGSRLLGESNGVGHRAENLGCAAEAVGILHSGVVFPVRLADLAVAQQLAHQVGGLALPPVRTGLVDPGIEWCRRAPECLEAHCRGRRRRAPENPGIVHQQRQDRGLHLRAVDEGQAFLRCEPKGPQAGAGECPRSRCRVR
jgi:hypothetical protein